MKPKSRDLPSTCAHNVGGQGRLVYAHGFSWRKAGLLRRFLPECSIEFVQDWEAIPAQATVVVWGSAQVPARQAPILRVEDGFLRSVGLGADLTIPTSWVVDSRGIYYDPRSESDLEALLQNSVFEPELIERAARLRTEIVNSGLTKYNVGASEWRRPPHATRVVLVVGQVEDDASIRLGATGIRTNLELLQTARRQIPGAYIVYKPHPDVVAGLRHSGSDEGRASRYCDEMLLNVSLSAVLGQVDEVHVMTSLAGFEALLRYKPVFAYGLPFYAGWGLTRDAQPVPRRMRRLTVDELTAGALILYPRYLSRITGAAVSPEEAVKELLEWRGEQPQAEGAMERALRAPVRRLLRWSAERR